MDRESGGFEGSDFEIGKSEIGGGDVIGEEDSLEAIDANIEKVNRDIAEREVRLQQYAAERQVREKARAAREVVIESQNAVTVAAIREKLGLPSLSESAPETTGRDKGFPAPEATSGDVPVDPIDLQLQKNRESAEGLMGRSTNSRESFKKGAEQVAALDNKVTKTAAQYGKFE